MLSDSDPDQTGRHPRPFRRTALFPLLLLLQPAPPTYLDRPADNQSDPTPSLHALLLCFELGPGGGSICVQRRRRAYCRVRRASQPIPANEAENNNAADAGPVGRTAGGLATAVEVDDEEDYGKRGRESGSSGGGGGVA
ncbi:hypothetical protein DFJ73DRAFT_774529 [Zopfochytrium polystomum]|nr:hypothetical protein DFJ73DRAFT_774529 [Zopfochytrium polystomum]